MEGQPSNEGEVGFAVQGSKGSAETEFYMLPLTAFTWEPDIVQDEEGEPEIGEGMDVSDAERYGHNGARVTGEGRARPEHMGMVMRAFGFAVEDVKFSFADGINDVIRVTDDGAAATDVDILSGTGATLVAGTEYTAAQVLAGLKAVLDGEVALTNTYTITYVAGKFVIANDGAVLSLHWSHANCNMAFTLGFDDGADDTGATTYTADYDTYGRFQFFTDVNETIRVTDDGGGPVDVDIISGTSAMLTQGTPYPYGMVCAGLKAVLDADTTLSQTYTVTYVEATRKFNIAHAGATLSLHWSHANSTIEGMLGFSDAADDTAATTYLADSPSWWGIKHPFGYAATRSLIPYVSILDKFDPSTTLDTVLYDFRLSNFALSGRDADAIRFTFEGRALNWGDAAGTETEYDQSSDVKTPHSRKGSFFFGSDDYKAESLTATFTTAENIIPALTQLYPEDVMPGRRAARGDMDIHLGAEASGGVFRATYYGSASGTAPSSTIVQRILNANFQSGGVITGLAGSTVDYYAIRLHADRARMLAYPLGKSGDDPEKATLAFQIAKLDSDVFVTLNNLMVSDYYD